MDILVVEDDRLMAETIRTIVRTIPGVKNVDIARDYDAALIQHSSKAYHMVLVDIYLTSQHRTGLDLCRAIREKDPRLPLIVITSDPSMQSLEKAFKTTVNDYIKKPFFPQELALRVKRWLNPSETRRLPIAYDSLSYRADFNEFYFSGQKIHLTKKNKALLLLFLQNHEKILAPDFLQEKLWGDYDPLENKRNVRSNIQLLRGSLKQAQCHHWIVTVRGEGYMLRKPHD